MSESVKWKIWYDDGQTCSSEEMKPEEAPLDGVVAIVEKRKDRTVQVYQGQEYYFWNGENWVAGQVGSLDRWLRAVLPAVKYGRWTKNSIFKDVMEEANRWP